MTRNLLTLFSVFLVAVSTTGAWAAGASPLRISLEPGDELTYRVVYTQFLFGEASAGQATGDFLTMWGLLRLSVIEVNDMGDTTLRLTATVESVKPEFPTSDLGPPPWSASSRMIVRKDGTWKELPQKIEEEDPSGALRDALRPMAQAVHICCPEMPTHVGLQRSGRPVRWISGTGSFGGPIEFVSEPRADGVVVLGLTPYGLDEERMVSGRMTVEIIGGRVIEGQMVQFRPGQFRNLHDVVLIEDKHARADRR